ncbi:MAG TPA: YciI family protein [Beijerinckiaceae bacterium]|jgi:uncharacterized protein YciI
MRFVIQCLDGAGRLPLRLEHRPAHKVYLATCGVDIRLSGPLVADDGETMIGSLFVVEAPDRAAAEAFHRDDPFSIHGVWEKVSIHAFLDVTNR